jgi:hypothetical protein
MIAADCAAAGGASQVQGDRRGAVAGETVDLGVVRGNAVGLNVRRAGRRMSCMRLFNARQWNEWSRRGIRDCGMHRLGRVSDHRRRSGGAAHSEQAEGFDEPTRRTAARLPAHESRIPGCPARIPRCWGWLPTRRAWLPTRRRTRFSTGHTRLSTRPARLPVRRTHLRWSTHIRRTHIRRTHIRRTYIRRTHVRRSADAAAQWALAGFRPRPAPGGGTAPDAHARHGPTAGGLTGSARSDPA